MVPCWPTGASSRHHIWIACRAPGSWQPVFDAPPLTTPSGSVRSFVSGISVKVDFGSVHRGGGISGTEGEPSDHRLCRDVECCRHRVHPESARRNNDDGGIAPRLPYTLSPL